MEVTEENLATMANYLKQTLSPDPNIRRPGKIIQIFYVSYQYMQLFKKYIDTYIYMFSLMIVDSIVLPTIVCNNAY